MNDNFVELLFWIDAFKRASASQVTAVIPFFSYAKGDKKDEPHGSIRARVCAGRLRCDKDHRTAVPHIFSVGDVVGFPSLASVSMEQGRRAVCRAFGQPFQSCETLPYGLFTIPEISMIGGTEEELTKDRVPYETRVARYREIARGQINGDQNGLLKLLFDRTTRKLLGVHCIGETATEIIHIGQAVMAFGGTINYFRDTVFNYPTMAECYKVAAFDGLNKLALDRNSSEDSATSVASPTQHAA